MFPLAEWAFYRFVADGGTETVPTFLNFAYQAITLVLPAILVVLMLTKLLHTDSMLYPGVCYAANLVYGLWWVPVTLVFGGSEETAKVIPMLPAAIAGTAFVYFGIAYFLVRRNAF